MKSIIYEDRDQIFLRESTSRMIGYFILFIVFSFIIYVFLRFFIEENYLFLCCFSPFLSVISLFLIDQIAKESELRSLKRKERKLKRSVCWRYVKNFAEKYMDAKYSEEELRYLLMLLRSKGFSFTRREIEYILQGEFFRIKYEELKEKMSMKGCEDFEDLVRYFLNLYWYNWREYFQAFHSYLGKVCKLKISSTQLLDWISYIERKLGLNLLKKDFYRTRKL